MVASRGTVQVIITIAVLVWAVMLILQGVDLEFGFLRPYSVAVGTAVVALNVYDKWLWKIPWLEHIPKRPPNLSGTWSGILYSEYVDPKTGEIVPPKKVFMAVEQTASSISIRQLTIESQSHSLTASLDKNAGLWVASYTYVNEPLLRHQKRSPMHLGAGVLNIHGSPPTSVDGQYWTSRDTKGEVRFSHRSKQLYTKFEDAEKDGDLSD
jgi:hypothetical protein